MDSAEDLAEVVRRLEARVQSLESLYGLIDLLSLPGMLAGGAMRIFDCTQAADTIAAQAVGFYGKETDGRGLSIRWTRYPQAGQLDIAVLESMPFLLRLRVLHTPNLSGSSDLYVTKGDGEQVSFESVGQPDNGVLEFTAIVKPESTGLVRLSLSSKSCLQEAGGDARQLGLPFVQLRSSPLLHSPPAG